MDLQKKQTELYDNILSLVRGQGKGIPIEIIHAAIKDVDFAILSDIKDNVFGEPEDALINEITKTIQEHNNDISLGKALGILEHTKQVLADRVMDSILRNRTNT